MSDSKPLVKVDPDTWVDLYAATGISVGTEVILNIISGNSLRVAFKSSEPTDEIAGVLKVGDWYKVGSGETGLWVLSPRGCQIAVQEV